MTARINVSMWEIVAAPGRGDALVDWVFRAALAELDGVPGYERAEVFRGADERVVVITWWTGEPASLGDPPPHLVGRPSQSWEFERVEPRARSR